MSPLDRLTCEETFERLNDYLDRELSAEEMARVKEHLNTCTICTSEYDFEASVLSTLKARLRRIDLPESVIAKVSAIIPDVSRPAE